MTATTTQGMTEDQLAGYNDDDLQNAIDAVIYSSEDISQFPTLSLFSAVSHTKTNPSPAPEPPQGKYQSGTMSYDQMGYGMPASMTTKAVAQTPGDSRASTQRANGFAAGASGGGEGVLDTEIILDPPPPVVDFVNYADRVGSAVRRTLQHHFEHDPLLVQVKLEADSMRGAAFDQLAAGISKCKYWSETLESLVNAATLYGSIEHSGEAAQCYSKAAELCSAFSASLEAAGMLEEAAGNFEGVDAALAARYYVAACTKYSDQLRYGKVAKCKRAIGRVLEGLGSFRQARDAYAHAAELYSSAHSRPMHSQCLEKAAQLSATITEYERAVENFEQLAELEVVKCRCFMAALLCVLAEASGDNRAPVIARSKMMFLEYQDRDKAFQSGPQYTLMRGLVLDCNDDLVRFDAAVAGYERREKFSAWETMMVARARENLDALLEEILRNAM